MVGHAGCLARNGNSPRRRARDRLCWLVLGFAVAGFGFAVDGRAETTVIGGTGAALGTIRILAAAFQETRADVAIEVPDSVGSDGAVKEVLKGIFTLGVASRPVADEERKLGIGNIPYARTPSVVATQAGHGDERLTSRELVEIYWGGRTTWADGRRIRLILRPVTSSLSRLLDESIPGMAEAQAAARRFPGIPVAFSDQDAMDVVEAIDDGVTAVTLSSIRSERRPLVPLTIDVVTPSIENLASGAYPMSETLYFVTGPEVSPLAREFVGFVRSVEGAEILREYGQIALSAGED